VSDRRRMGWIVATASAAACAYLLTFGLRAPTRKVTRMFPWVCELSPSYVMPAYEFRRDDWVRDVCYPRTAYLPAVGVPQ